MKISTLVYGFVVFSIIVSAFAGFSAHIANNYGVEISSDLNSLNQMSEYRDYALEMQEELDNPFSGIAGLDVVFTTVVAGYTAIQPIFKMMSSVTSLILSIGGLLPLPIWLIDGVTILIIFTIVFSLIAILTGRDL